MAAASAGASRTIAIAPSYGVLSHLWPSVVQLSASSMPAVNARFDEARAQSPNAPSTCTQAPAARARGTISANGSNSPVLTSPALSIDGRDDEPVRAETEDAQRFLDGHVHGFGDDHAQRRRAEETIAVEIP